MSNLQSYDYPVVGEWARKTMSYTQAIRVGDTIVCSGQGGWDRNTLPPTFPTDLKAEVDQAFANVDACLKHAGGKGWKQVFRVVTYSTDLRTTHDLIVDNYRRWMSTPGHCPTWTELGVSQLGADDMHVEIEVQAYDPEGAAAATAERRGRK